ncbi:DNA polymerase III subunit chi [Orrella sp. 11846]|uniref:DNA polymerase III subunit chi n=1 Tax=Orrella sp. 11846 TaxID=3409913 RepID=UPI003B5B0C07
MRVDFAFNAPNRISQAVQTTVKQTSRGVQILVYCPNHDMAKRYSQQLWATPGTAFIANDWFAETQQTELPVYLFNDDNWHLASPELLEKRWLLNLHLECPPIKESPVQRILEFVSSQEQDREFARKRWSDYKKIGYQIVGHDLAAR